MELIFCSLLLLFFLLNLLLNPKPNLPPGPWNLPIIGSLHHLVGTSLPHYSFRRLSSIHGPIMLLKLGEIPFVVASSPAAAREVLKTHDLSFCSRPISNPIAVLSYSARDMIFAPYGDYWRQVRRICILELFSPRRVASFRALRQQEVFNLIRTIAIAAETASNAINLSEKLAELGNNVITRAVIGGGRREDQAAFLAALRETMEITSGFTVAELFPTVALMIGWFSGSSRKLERVHKRFDRMLEEIIREHRERRERRVDEREEDLVDVLIRIQEEGGLEQFSFDSRNIKAIVFVSHIG